MAKSKYESYKEEMKKKVQAAGGCRYSKDDLRDMANQLINDTEYEMTRYIKDVNAPVNVNLSQKYRDSLKPTLKQLGLDAAEVERINDVQFSKDHAEAVTELGVQIVKDYIDVGRKMIFPINAQDESQMEICVGIKDETVEDTMKIVKTVDVDGNETYERVPTGKRVTTKQHREIKASNKKPGWLQDIEMI